MATPDPSTPPAAPPPPQIAASGFFAVRTPLLPFDELVAWSAGLAAVGSLGDPGGLAAALASDRRRLRQRLVAALSRPELRDALFVASPSVDEAFDVWVKDADSERGRRVEPAVVAYFSRAATRPTPFGLFAGSTTGSLGAQTRVQLPAHQCYRRHSRLDMDYLWALADAVERDPHLRGGLVYRPNSSLYEVAGRLRLVEARRADTGRSYHLVAVDPSPYLTAVLDWARQGATVDELATLLVDDEITKAEAEAYVTELIASQLLVSDLPPVVTGEEPLHPLIDVLAADPATAPLTEALTAARTALASIDAQGLGVPPDRYRTLAALLDELPARPELSRLVQVDLVKPAQQATLGPRVVAELVRGVRLLHRLTPAQSADSLARFRQAFTARYETREVALVEALDEETGIGFDRSASPLAEATPLLAGLPFPATEPEARWSRRDAFLLEKLTVALAERRGEIRLEPGDLDALGSEQPAALPDAFHVAATVAAESAEAIGRGVFQVLLQGVAGPSGARLLGRFCHADETLRQGVCAHLRAEEACRPEAVFAEVVHLPEGRVGNVLCRPVLRGHEIAYLGRSGARPDCQLAVTDLLVSVHDGRIVLRSRRLGRQVLPRLTTAHNYSQRSLGLYRFLCALQHQDVAAGLGWDWGPLADAPFLPRVVSGRLVLARACWRLTEHEIRAVGRTRDAAQFATVQTWRAQRQLPRYVALVDADNELVCDLDNVLSVAALAHQLRGRRSATLVELFPGPDQLWVTGPEGHFVAELVVPFVRPAPAPPPPAALAVAAPVRRRFPPGSDWLYAKLYTGTATADAVLDRLAGPVAAALGSGAADGWFFLRYADPDPHLRLRLHGPPERLHEQMLPALHAALAPLLEAGQVWRVQLDTYEREVERYGGAAAIELAEQIFAADSAAALAIVRSLAGDGGQEWRWRLALCGIDLLFDDLGLSLEDKRGLARQSRQGLGREFGVDGAFRNKVSARFRQHRPALERLCNPAAGPPPAAAPGLAALRQRSRQLAPLVGQLRRLAQAGQLAVAMPELAASFAHMHVNRVLRAAPRAQELVLYELLDRLYAGQAARRR